TGRGAAQSAAHGRGRIRPRRRARTVRCDTARPRVRVPRRCLPGCGRCRETRRRGLQPQPPGSARRHDVTDQRYSSYIAGQWVEGEGDHANENPSDLATPVGHYGRLDAERTSQAVDAAAAALPKWSLSNPQQRADILDAVGSEILARKEELGRMLAREEGKTLPESIGEAARAGQIFKFFAGEALRIPGEKLASTRPGVDVEITREPVGTVGIIAPWNFPLAIPAWKIAPALAYGNTVVFKPAEIVPGCAWAIAEILSRAGLPEGAF